jgi:uncharacterized protein (DUF3820 family)
LTFGKYAGQKLIDVYNHRSDYIDWLEQNVHKPELLNQIAAMKQWIKNKEEDL